LKAQRGCPTLKLPAAGQPVENFGIMLQKQVQIVQMHLLLLLLLLLLELILFLRITPV